MRSGYSVLAELFFYGFICKMSKIFAFHRKMIFSNFPLGLKVFPNLFQCVYYNYDNYVEALNFFHKYTMCPTESALS